MSRIIFAENSCLNDPIFGKVQAPIRFLLEQLGESFEQKSLLPGLFHQNTSENFGDLYVGTTEMDDFEPVGENGAPPETSFQAGYEKLIQYETWKSDFQITQEAIEDGKVMNLRDKPAKFIRSYHRTRERFGAALYGAALNGKTAFRFGKRDFDASCMDRGALFHTAHKPKVKGPAQCNCFSDAFSVTALDYAESAMQNFRDEDGNIVDIAPDTIVIPNDAELKRAVFAAIGADQDPLTANNAFNYQYGRWTVIIHPLLNQYLPKGDACPWILLDSAANETYKGAIFTDRVKLTVDSYRDRKTDANVWHGRARFNAGFNNWRFACAGGMSGGSSLKDE